VQGSTGFADLVQAKNREDRRFKAVVKGTRPVFVPFEKGEKGRIKAWEAAQAAGTSAAKKVAQPVPPAHVSLFTVPPPPAPAVAPTFSFGTPLTTSSTSALVTNPSPFCSSLSTPANPPPSSTVTEEVSDRALSVEEERWAYYRKTRARGLFDVRLVASALSRTSRRGVRVT
jgi:hypothetical protein